MASVGAWKGKPVPVLVLHVDMDAFFASVEVRSDPRLRGRALAVGGGPGGRGVVTSASYEARSFGVRSGMSMAEALVLCPGLLALPVDSAKVVSASLDVLKVLDRHSSRVEAASIDEAYLELPSIPEDRWIEEAWRAGGSVRRSVRDGCRLPCSVGVGINKMQAKMATARAKPDGVYVLAPGRFLDVFGASSVSAIPGIGPRTCEVLEAQGIRTIHELARRRPRDLQRGMGRWGALLSGQARGLDGRQVLAAGEEPLPKSAGHEMTFARDVSDPTELKATLWLLADRVARRIRVHHLSAGGVMVRFKVGKRRYSKQERIAVPTQEARRLALTGWRLLEAVRRRRALRLLGIAGFHLIPEIPPPGLLPRDIKHSRLQEAGDRLRDRFGERAVLPAGVFSRGPTRSRRRS